MLFVKMRLAINKIKKNNINYLRKDIINMNNLKILETNNEFVTVYETDKNEKVVNTRDLWAVLESKQDFSTWIKKRLNECDAIENEDYICFHKKMEANNATLKEYIVKLNIAKEMAMLERNDKGKQVRRYFIQVEEKFKKLVNIANQVSFKEQLEAAEIVANMLDVNKSSKLVMIKKVYEQNNVPSGLLPDYVESGDNNQICSATELLNKFNLGMKIREFNKLMLEKGYLEERSRISKSTKSGVKMYKTLTKKGLVFGENMISSHNQKEVQPLYYEGKFLDLYKTITEK